MIPAYMEKGNRFWSSQDKWRKEEIRGVRRAVEAKGLSSFRLGQAREGHRDTEHELICT